MVRVLPDVEAAVCFLVALLQHSCMSWGGVSREDVRSLMLRDA